MTAPRPGDAFHLDLDGSGIAGRYTEVDPPHRLLVEWDRQGSDKALPTTALIEITFIPAGNSTRVIVKFFGLSAEDAAFFVRLLEQYFALKAASMVGAEPGAFPEIESRAPKAWHRRRAGIDRRSPHTERRGATDLQ